ncbi:MAG: DinB family protein [Chitinophagales bacterium]
MKITRPQEGEYPLYFDPYVRRVVTDDLLAELEAGKKEMVAFIEALPAEKHSYRYAEGKWTIKEMLSHIIDAERIFVYRALRFSRKDSTPLPGFEEDEYVPNSNAANRSMQQLLKEYVAVREATIAFFDSITEEMSLRQGVSNGKNISVRAFGYMIQGHQQHHINVVKERYMA